jgi:hypothetical protein
MPAELRMFDPLEWAGPDEFPDPGGCQHDNWPGYWDYQHAHQRYTRALVAWFGQHPDADFLTFLRGRRSVS